MHKRRCILRIWFCSNNKLWDCHLALFSHTIYRLLAQYWHALLNAALKHSQGTNGCLCWKSLFRQELCDSLSRPQRSWLEQCFVNNHIPSVRKNRLHFIKIYHTRQLHFMMRFWCKRGLSESSCKHCFICGNYTLIFIRPCHSKLNVRNCWCL